MYGWVTCYDFWFHFVMARTSEIEQGLGEVVASRVVGQRLNDYLGHEFERVCAQWLVRRARAGRLPVLAMLVGSWWGPDPRLHEQTDIDVLAADTEGKTMLVGECKYRESFDETFEVEDLECKRDVVKGYHATDLYLFSKFPVASSTRGKYAGRPDVHFVSLTELYGVGEGGQS